MQGRSSRQETKGRKESGNCEEEAGRRGRHVGEGRQGNRKKEGRGHGADAAPSPRPQSRRQLERSEVQAQRQAGLVSSFEAAQ